ncbi:S9 family peptidase [Helcobacillus massiliensis]|uniref:S9 family peptidase n=1 Tax=Helcobacillus massiliensis TaxID=521392 RepID=UPI0039EFFE2C
MTGTETPQNPSAERTIPPIPHKRPIIRSHHGDDVVDDFDWLRDKENPEVIEHLTAENAYSDTVMAPLKDLRGAITEEIRSHTQETDTSVPFRDGDFWYLTRTREGDDYPRYSRIRATGDYADAPPVIDDTSDALLDGEEIILDAQALAEGEEFFSLGGMTVNDASNRLAYAVDTTGGEVYRLIIKDLTTGDIIDDGVTDIAYGLAFSTDGSRIIYATNNDAWRQYRIHMHTIGAPQSEDRLILEEEDEKFMIGFSESRDGTMLVAEAASRTTSECWIMPLDDPDAEPVTVGGRTPGLEYSVEWAGDHLLIVHNATTSGFSVAACAADSVGPRNNPTDTPGCWADVLDAASGERIAAVDAFASHIAVSMRADGRPAVRIIPRAEQADGGREADGGSASLADRWNARLAWDISHGGELDGVDLVHNNLFEQTTVRYALQSMLTPLTIAEIDATAGPQQQPTILKVKNVPNFDARQYREHRLWATAQDGTAIPISLVHRAEVKPDGGNPGFLYGYGSYEIPSDPSLVPSWLSMLDRGVVVAIAHIRGGGEMGRDWYDNGKMLKKKNTFTDFVDCAQFLVDEGWFHPDRIAAEGGSAGGLLMGAVANLAPEKFRAIHAAVPFVDALTTILDPSLPLTVGEWEEWGNPLEDPEVYRYMKGYSPTENIRDVQYPAILATTSLNDIRVFFVEPAKWVARLREETSNYSGRPEEAAPIPDRPILFKLEMVAGHGGRSGRYAKWEERAEQLAFLLDQIDATQLLTAD